MKAEGLLVSYMGAALATCVVVGAVLVGFLFVLLMVIGSNSSIIEVAGLLGVPVMTGVVAYTFYYTLPAVAAVRRLRATSWINVPILSLFPALAALVLIDDVSIGVFFAVFMLGIVVTSAFHASVVKLRKSTPLRHWLELRHRAVAFVFFCILCVPLLAATVLIKVSVATEAELRDVALGFPLPFVRQNLSALDPPFPNSFRMMAPQEHPVRIVPTALLTNIILLATPLWFFYLLLRRYLQRAVPD